MFQVLPILINVSRDVATSRKQLTEGKLRPPSGSVTMYTRSQYSCTQNLKKLQKRVKSAGYQTTVPDTRNYTKLRF